MFNGSPFTWVEFVTKFKDIVNDQCYLNNSQKLHYLQQHVTGEARRAISGLPNGKRGHVLSLKRLKYTFRQRSRIAQARLEKITRGKQISKTDKGLLEFYYTISDCLITLHQLNYDSNINSADVLRKAIRRLPYKFYERWSELTLVDLETWLSERIQALTDPYLLPGRDNNSESSLRQDEKFKTQIHTTEVKEEFLSVKEATDFIRASHI